MWHFADTVYWLVFTLTTTLKNLSPTKDIRSVSSNLNNSIVVKLVMCYLPEISVHFWQKNFLCWCCADYKKNWEKLKERIMKTIHCNGIHFWRLYLRCQLAYTAIFSLYFRDIIQCNWFGNVIHLFKYSLCESSLNFHEFLIMPMRRISINTNKEIHSWWEIPIKWKL